MSAPPPLLPDIKQEAGQVGVATRTMLPDWRNRINHLLSEIRAKPLDPRAPAADAGGYIADTPHKGGFWG
jgi:hypothetical protein